MRTSAVLALGALLAGSAPAVADHDNAARSRVRLTTDPTVPVGCARIGIVRDDSIKDLGDQASSAYNREFLFELGNGDRRVLKEVAAALAKLDEGGFGDCERCGEAISEKRLEALPFARYCIDCQRAVEEEERSLAR